MKASKTSKAWMREHINDAFVKKARAEGYRSRAAYKLMEIDDRDHLLRPGSLVVDLGATPGGWSQVAAERLKGNGRVIALDLLPLDPLRGVTFIQGDFREDAVVAELLRVLEHRAPDLVIADMAPNISGIAMSDQARAMYLCELARDFAAQHLAPGGAFLVKTFQGAGFDEFYRSLREIFDKVVTRKPKASRDRSPETYLLGLGRRPPAGG